MPKIDLRTRLPLVEVLQRSACPTSICVGGWIRSQRTSKAGIVFISLYDGSCAKTLQLILKEALPNYLEAQQLTIGCSIMASGQLVDSLGAGQSIELLVECFEILGKVEDPGSYPMAAKAHSLEHLRTVAHLRPRSQLIGAVTRIRHHMTQAIHHFFSQSGFYWLNTPILTGADCEGGGELFRVTTIDLETLPLDPVARSHALSEDFFGQPAFLTVSGQLNAEAYACALSKVYTFGPTFRAENSNTSRHLAEFWMVEPEVAFEDLNGIILLAEALLQAVANALLQQTEADLVWLGQHHQLDLISRLKQLASGSFAQIDYRDALGILQKESHRFAVQALHWGSDLMAEHERFLAETYFQKPLFVKNYPKDLKAFYMRLNADGESVAATDLLVPGIGELIGGSQREERLQHLMSRMQELQLNVDAYQWYLDLRRYGSVPHAGFGLGLERLVGYCTGAPNIREAIPFPRSPRALSF